MRTLMAALLMTLATGALAQEAKVQLKDGPGKDKAAVCVACHSVDYIAMNSRFMTKAGWTASINKMINAFGAPLAKDDVDALATYLTEQYGVP